ncbi:caspase-3-like [Diadema antillarum]|uniref:caspase-3-like n=1 Tax=Diadema antillarum TaxID=105358 RepID=UPI003A88426D
MGSKVSSSQHLVEAEPDSGEDKLQRSLTMSSATDLLDERGQKDDGDGDIADDIQRGPSLNNGLGIQSIDVVAIDGYTKGHDEAFDINENFDYDSDQITIDSDIMTMDNIQESIHVVDIGIGKGRHSSREAVSGKEGLGDEPDLPENVRSMRMDEINVNVLQSSSLHLTSQSVYSMNHPNRGRAVIVNETQFEPVTGVDDRQGTNPDVRGLERVFGNLGFETETHTDLTVFDFKALICKLIGEDFSRDDCFVLVVMSHGNDDFLYCKDGRVVMDEVVDAFKGDSCPGLVGKPKLFFFQACRGTRLDRGVQSTNADNFDETDAGQDPRQYYTIPVEADYLLAYSSPPGYYSWRSLSEGCWFIQALVKVFEKYGTCMELVQMMTRVNRTVAYSYESSTRDSRLSGLKQMPCFVSTLTKELYFTPKK